MTPNEVAALFQSIVDDESLDTTTLFTLMDTAYTKRNDSRMWTFLLGLDTSITHASSDDWTTTHDLPADFSEVYRIFGGAADNEYLPVPFDRILEFISAMNRYSVDYANDQIRFTGAPGSALTVYLWYKKFPTSLIGLTDVQKDASTTIVWPKRFAPILAYDMAELYFGGIEADEITRQMAPYQRAAYKSLERAMIQWDTRRMMKMMDNSSAPLRGRDTGSPADVLDWPQ